MIPSLRRTSSPPGARPPKPPSSRPYTRAPSGAKRSKSATSAWPPPRSIMTQPPCATSPNPASPAQVTSAGLSLADAIALARERNPAYRQAQNNRGPAAWGVRNAYSSLLIPSVTASGGMSYTGPGSQTFLAQSFSQSGATGSSFYDVGLSWQLSGSTLSQPGLAKAQLRAADADIAGAENLLITGIKQQYLTVRQADAQADLAKKTLQRNEEFLKLAP